MGVRREGREAAVQFLYQRDLNPASDTSDVEAFYKMRGLSPSARKFSDLLIRGVLENHRAIDEIIRENTDHYELNRLSAVDRNILRLAIFEMKHCPDIPPIVSINEGIEIAKKYSTADSGKFVNGVLDRVRSRLALPARTARP